MLTCEKMVQVVFGDGELRLQSKLVLYRELGMSFVQTCFVPFLKVLAKASGSFMQYLTTIIERTTILSSNDGSFLEIL